MISEKSGYLKVIFVSSDLVLTILQVLIRVLRTLLDPYCISSYGHTDEDRIIGFCFSDKNAGFVLRVGE